MVTRLYVSNFIKQILTFHDNCILFYFIFFSFQQKKENWILWTLILFFLFQLYSPIPTPFPRIPILIPRIPTPIPRVLTLIPRVPSHIHCIPTKIPRIPTPISCIPIRIPLIPRIPVLDSPFRLLQIVLQEHQF